MIIHLADPAPSVSPTPVGYPGPVSTRWRKELLRTGSWVHPNNPARRLKITPEFLSKLVDNFRAARRDRTPVQRSHSSDWTGTVGDVEDLTIDGDRLIATLAVADDEAENAIATRRVTGVSAAFDDDWSEKATGESHGPTLLHVALTNSPYISGLTGFTSLSEPDSYVFLSEDDPDEENEGTASAAISASLVALSADEKAKLGDTVLRHSLTESEAAEVARLAALAAERLPARHAAAGDAFDDEDDPETYVARMKALTTLTPDEQVLREDITRAVRTQHPDITESELDEVARLAALADRYR